MPISVLIETGNNINNIKDKGAKQNSVQKFLDILQMFIEDQNPWFFYGYDFNQKDIDRIIKIYSAEVYRKVGAGDVFIIDSYCEYIKKLKSDKKQNHRISIWSKDDDLTRYSQDL